MQNCVGYLPRKTFNTYGIVLLTLFGFFALIVIGISASLIFDTSFHCYDKTISKKKEPILSKDINIKCSLEYQEKFRTNLIFGLLILNFGVVFALSIIYGYLVKHRVEKFDHPTRPATTNNENDENEEVVQNSGQNPRDVRECLGRFSTFFIYIIHLIVARIVPMLIFAIIFYLSDIPAHFSCPWTADLDLERRITSNSNVTLDSSYNLTMIGCTNPVGGKIKTLIDVVATVDVLVLTLTFVELGYTAWLTFNDRNFITDQEFCTVYLLRKRKRIRKMVNNVRERFNPDDQEVFQLKDDFGDTEISLRNLKDIYVNVIIQEGRENMNAYPQKFDRHMIYDSHLETPKEVTKLTSPVEMFKPRKNDRVQKYPRKILVIGRPGIGKTVLTKKLLQQWNEKNDKFWREKIVILIEFRALNNKNVTLREMLGYGEGLSRDDFDSMYNSVLSNPAQTILIFDGLDELLVDSSLLNTKINANQSPDKKMTAFTILKQLFRGNFLPGVIVLITSRPTAKNVLQYLEFERTVEILGFFEEQIKEYVFKFCKDNNDTAELIWNHIKESAELFSLCYVPVNSYIVCLTLKESIENDQSSDTPKTVTELYKKAVNVLIYRHHPIYKSTPRPSDYLIISFPEELENDFSKLKEVAKWGVAEGRLIFERPTRDEFGDLANCGLFHKLPDKRRNYFCFLHLTLQEFLAASKVVDDMDNVDEFLATHIDDPKWHLVIQFVFGLIGDKIKEAKGELLRKWQRILVDVQKRLEGWVFLLGNNETHEKNIALLAIKCLHELQHNDTRKSTCSKFLAGGSGELRLERLNITPVDSGALFEFLGISKNLIQLTFDNCPIKGDNSYKKMLNSLVNNPTNFIISLSCIGCFRDQRAKFLSEALKSKHCKLTSLNLSCNGITDQSVEYLSEALKSGNCKLTSLNFGNNTIPDQGAEYLSEALKSENCKLTSLNLSYNGIKVKGAKYLSEALKSENCKLTSLNLGYNRITDQGAENLSEALKSESCQLTSLNLCYTGITDQGAEYLSEALKSENCKLTSLNFGNNTIPDQGAEYLSEALKSENCKLTSLNLSYNGIKDQGAEYLSEALKSENCKLTSLNLGHNIITDQGAEYLSEALNSGNCKLHWSSLHF